MSDGQYLITAYIDADVYVALKVHSFHAGEMKSDVINRLLREFLFEKDLLQKKT